MTIYTRNTEGVLTPLKLPVIKGKDGKDGKNGVTPNITLGEVNTMESGEEVNVIIKGDKENPILDFNLPKGEEGLNIALSSDKIDRKLKRIDSRVKEIETKNEEQEERIKEVENKEKKQNFYINGLFNENEDGRVSIEEEGNDIKLESSRKGFVEVDKIAGDTITTSYSDDTWNFPIKKRPVSISHRHEVIRIPCRKGTLNDIIYYRVNIILNKLDVEDGGLGITSFRDSGGYNKAEYMFKKSDIGKTLDLSIIRKIDDKCERKYNTIVIGLCGELPEGTTDGVEFCNFTINEHVVVNLTEVFGSGNEPTKEWCDKNIPYIETMQSTFEDKLVTQEMVDSGLEKAENLGKYKMNLKVRGKNRFSPEVIDALCDLKNWNGTGAYRTNKVAYSIFWENINRSGLVTISVPTIKVPPRFYPILLIEPAIRSWILGSGTYKNDESDEIKVVAPINNTPSGLDKYGTFTGAVNDWNQESMDKLRNVLEQGIMVERGHNSPTPYEPYFEHSKTVYLNSPFHKGDEIVWKEDGLYHYHKMGKVIFDGSDDELFVYNKGWKDFRWEGFNIGQSSSTGGTENFYCDKFNFVNYGTYIDSDTDCVLFASNRVTFKVYSIPQNTEAFKSFLQQNHITVVFPLAEPYYEKISDDKLLLEIPENATLHIDSTIPCQNTKVNYTSKIPNLLTMEDDISNINKCSIDMIANNFDMDYRLLEVEWALEDIGINLVDTRRINNTGLSRFHQAKLLITSGEYDKEKLTCQLSEYLERRYLDQEEFNELIDLMD